MAIERSLYQAPEGIEGLDDFGLDDDSPVVEINVVDPEQMSVEIDGDSFVLVSGEPEFEELVGFDANLAEHMSEEAMQTLASDLIEMVDSDIDSRKEWAETFTDGLEVLGMKYEEKSEPWDGACGVFSTVLAEAAIRFQAETMSETFPASGPVKTKIIGDDTKEKKEAAERVRNDMNYQLTERMEEYRSEHERMLYSLGLSGSAFKKVYYDPNMNRQISIYVPAEEVVVPYGASHLSSAERVTHLMRKTTNEMMKLQSGGFYRDVELGEPQSFHTDIEKKKAGEAGITLNNDDRYTLYEIHADLVLDGFDNESDDDETATDIPKPYVVTVDKGTNEVLGIRRNWDENDPTMRKNDYFVHYVYVPGFGFYGLGLIHIIGGYARTGTSLIRQLVDAGTLANLPGGLKARGLRVTGDDGPIPPGEWRDVDVPSGSIRDNIMPLPYKEPSQVLLMLLDKITDEGRRLGAISDLNVSDMSANAPVGTTLALLERTLKPMAAVQARVHYAMKQELKMLKRIIADYAPVEYDYQPSTGEVTARQSDYQMVDVIPVSDPNSSTMAQRVVQYQAALQMAQQMPDIYDIPILHRQMLEVLGIKEANKIIPITDDLEPVDPISENMNALNAKPVKAFIYQDHDAHISTHISFMQNPMIAQGIGQNPNAQMIMAALQAHIAEHLGFKYRKEIEDKLGVGMPKPNAPLPEEIEIQLSRLVADASGQLTQQKQQEAAQQQQQEAAQDPQLQIQQAELQIKQSEIQRKAQKDQNDAQYKRQEQIRKSIKDELEIELEKEKIAIDRREVDIEAQKISAELSNERIELDKRIQTQRVQEFINRMRGMPGA